MRTRPLAAVILALAVSTGCSRPGSKAPPERFVAADAAAVFVVPTVEALSSQGSDLLAAAATFPGGQTLLDGRAVLQARLGFDPFDASSVAGAGLDPKRGAAVGVRLATADKSAAATAEESLALALRSGSVPEIVVSLPVGDARKLDATVTRVARERLGLEVRAAEEGKPEVISYRRADGDAVRLAYAIAEGTAVMGFGAKAVEDVRAALAVPRDAHIGTTAAFKAATAAAGTGLAVLAFLPPGSPLLQGNLQAKDGLAVGVRGSRDRLELLSCTLLAAREAAVRDGLGKRGSPPLLAKLDPGAGIVMRGEGDPSAMLPREQLAALFHRPDLPETVGQAVLDAYDAIGNGSALGFGLVPVADGTGAPLLKDQPFAFFRFEVVLALKDAARMRALLSRLPEEVRRNVQQSGDGLSTLPVPGGEIGWVVQQDRFIAVAGPRGSLRALVDRTGSTFKAPTPTSAKALEAPAGGLYVDVPRLAKAVQAIPAASYGTEATSGAARSTVNQWATTAARITAVSGASELIPGAQRSTLVVEVAPAAR